MADILTLLASGAEGYAEPAVFGLDSTSGSRWRCLC